MQNRSGSALRLTGLLWLALACTTPAYELSIGVHQAEPGASAQIPITLDTATNIASVHLQINYDATILSVGSVTNSAGTIGALFDMQYTNRDGTVEIVLVNETGVGALSGTLVFLAVTVNPGALPGMRTDLALARGELGANHGEDLATANLVTRSDGRLWVVFGSADRDGDGLSDYAEQMLDGSPDYRPGRTDTDVTKADTDGDTMRDGWEVAHSLNPLQDEAAADYDLDGVDNVSEYVADTDPRDSDSLLALTNISVAAGELYIDWQGGSSAWQYLEFGLHPTSENWTAFFTNQPPTELNGAATFTATNKAGVFRIKAER